MELFWIILLVMGILWLLYKIGLFKLVGAILEGIFDIIGAILD